MDIAHEVVSAVSTRTNHNLSFGTYHQEVVLLPNKFPVQVGTFHPAVECDDPELPLAFALLNFARSTIAFERTIVIDETC